MIISEKGVYLMNRIKQLYQSVKLLHKSCEIFASCDIRRGNAQIRYEQYYIDRAIAAFNELIKENILEKKQEETFLLKLCEIHQMKAGYDFLMGHNFKPWDKAPESLRKQMYHLSFNTIGEYIYPWVEEKGKLKFFAMYELLTDKKFDSYIMDIDEKLLNEDIWLMLYLLDFLLLHDKVLESKYIAIQIAGNITLQSAILKSKDQLFISEQLMDCILTLLKSNLNDKSNQKQLFSHFLYLAKIQGFNITSNRKDNLAWIEGYFKIEPIDNAEVHHLDWNSLKQA